jgi:uncharacterized metal-binding protein YceD (DUF177 family)
MSTPPVEFSRLMALDDIGDETALTLEPTAQELEALSQRMKVEVLALKGRLTVTIARDRVSHKVCGSFSARVIQICSILLEPFEQTIEETFTVYFSPEGHPSVTLMEQEDQELYTDPNVDMGEVMVQYFCLSLDDHPVCPAHKTIPKPEVETQPVAKKNPFEALSALVKGKGE